MSDDNDLLEHQNSYALHKGNKNSQLTCDLHTKGNIVYLPQIHPIDFKSDEYEKEFLKPLPDDIASEVSSVLKSSRSHFTPLNLAIILFFLVSGIGTIYYYFPRQIIVTTDTISRKSLSVSAKYNNLVADAQKKLEKKQWSSVVERLEDKAKEISQDKTLSRENGLLLGTYFDAVEHSMNGPSETPKEIIKNVRRHCPDRLAWHLDSMALNYPECRTGRVVEANWKRAQEIKKFLEKQANAPFSWVNAPDYEENNAILDLYWARLNFCYWVYLTPTNKLNKNSPGVAEREKAYEIAKKYTDSSKISKDFLQLQIDIIATIIKAGMGWGDGEGRAWFDGKNYWREKTLQGILEGKKHKMQKLEQSK